MFGIGGTELFIIVFFALLIFGPDKLPKMGRTIGKWMGEFNRAKDQVQAQIKNEMEGLEKATNPFPDKDKEADEGEEAPEEAPTPQAPPAGARADIGDALDWDEEEEEAE